MLFVTVTVLIFVSCKHDVTCETLGFKMDVTPTNATDADSGDGELQIKLSGGSGFSCTITKPYDDTYTETYTESNETYIKKYLDTGHYTINARNSFGCSKSSTVVIGPLN